MIFFSYKNCWTIVAMTINAYAFHKCTYYKFVINNNFIHIRMVFFQLFIIYMYLTKRIVSISKLSETEVFTLITIAWLSFLNILLKRHNT